ncbi:MAG: tRNA epoxyqueuosine(34) reductase QueG [Capsulimonadales bacterium]|nr:tRNA epoxyqueuosine(34) reductase QueG [Capsulimonadales bacterium]
MTPEERIREVAREIGFDAVGFTGAEPPDHADYQRAWLAAGMQGAMGYLKHREELRAGALDSPNLLAGTRSVILLALSYDRPRQPSPVGRHGVVARYARGEDYHEVMREKLRLLATQMETLFPGTRTRGFCDSGPIRERELAARAGLGWQGKHTNLISLDLGNWFFLGALLTTLPLRADAPVTAHCGTCTRCLAACPTGALVAPLTLDARRCISYLTIELRGPIPRELRSQMGNRIFGCDDCLAACPWNDRARESRELRFAARADELAFPDLLDWLRLLGEEAAFRRKFAGTPLLRPKREGLRRNVCIALGNIGEEDAVLPLTDALRTDPSPIVRGAAAWALGQIARRMNSQAARAALRAARAAEPDETVLEEIAFASDARSDAL